MTPRIVLETVRREKFRGRFFSGVEACHKGPILSSQVLGALFIDKHDPSVFEWCNQDLDLLRDALVSFCETLPISPSDTS